MIETTAPALTEADIRAALDAIIDPCSRAMNAPIGVDAMGLVDRVAVTAHSVEVTLLTTSPLCLMAGVFLSEAREKLTALCVGRTINVTLSPSVDWTPARVRNSQLREAVG